MRNPFHATAEAPRRPSRLRRSCLAVPATEPRKVAKAAASDADQVVLDLEDAVPPERKKAARAEVAEALATTDWGDKVVAVRVNDATTPFQYGDVIEVVTTAGEHVDCLMVPKVQDAGQLWFLEHLLCQLEADLGLPRRIGLEVQIETATGSTALAAITRVTDRLETVVFGPGDYAADLGIPQLDIGVLEPGYPGHQWHQVMAGMVTAARAVGRDAIDGPYGDYGDPEGFRESAQRARLLGMDGKWCIHPSQIADANAAFTPTAEQLDQAVRLLEAYAAAVDEGRGAATLDGRMIDEASRRMAEKLVARGRAAGLEVRA